MTEAELVIFWLQPRNYSIITSYSTVYCAEAVSHTVSYKIVYNLFIDNVVFSS